jgi:hypothetical protein
LSQHSIPFIMLVEISITWLLYSFCYTESLTLIIAKLQGLSTRIKR